MNSASLASLRRSALGFLATMLLLGSTALAETVVYRFQNNGSDGISPVAGLVLRSGKLYGTTQSGGQFDAGTAFELDPPAAQGDVWTETVLYSFGVAERYDLTTRLIFDKPGNLYGATCEFGGNGKIYQLVPPVPPTTSWTENVIHIFRLHHDTGNCPQGG